MYGWIDGYGILFDPVVQQQIKSIPEWANGWGGVNTDVDFIVTSCTQASSEIPEFMIPGIYIRPSRLNAEKRLSEKELIQTPIGDYYYPCRLPFDKYKNGIENWQMAGSYSVAENAGKLHVAFELFSMIWSWNGDWPERRLIEGADIFTSLLFELNPRESNNYSDYSKEFQSLRVDFQSYGINRFFIQWFLEYCGEDKNTVTNADYHYLQALELFNSRKFDAVRKSLKNAFSELSKIRKLHSNLEMYFLDYPHLGILLEDKGFFELEWPQYTRETMLSYFDNIEKHGYKVSLEAGASCWNQLIKRFPELGSKLRELWNSGKIDLTNGTYSLPYALVSPLILQYWQFKLGKETFEKVFKKSPVTYQCQENSLTPQLPELLLHFGYKQALHITQNHGEAPAEDVDFIQWQSPAGLSIPSMTVKDVTLSRKAVNYFLDLPLIHYEYADDNQAINYINFQDIGYIPFRIQMIRAHKYADVWGRYALTEERFEAGFVPKEAPEKTYTADSYKISAGAFYPNETNVNALSHYENIFQKNARLRQFELTEYYYSKNQKIAENILNPVSRLCLLEAHDMAYVQGKRRGEFYASLTVNPPPYSREELTEEVGEINKKLECDLNKLTSEASLLNNGKLLFNASESFLSFAKVINPEKYTGDGLLEYDGKYYACGLFAPFDNFTPNNSVLEEWKEISTIGHDTTAIRITPDNTGRFAITYKNTTLHCIPVSCREAAFTLLSVKAYTSGSLYLTKCLYQLNGKQLQSVMLDIIYSEDSDYIEFNLKYAPSNDFDVVDRWSDYLALEFDFESAAKNIWRFNPNVRSITNEDRIVSPYSLGVEMVNGNKISLLNEGSFHYDINRSKGKIRWLFHVASETVHKRKMALAFDTTDAFLLSRAWSQGVIPVNDLEGYSLMKNKELPFFKIDLQDISIEGFVEKNTLLISNLRDRIISSPFPNGTVLKNMLGKKINSLNQFELALLEFKSD
jgi:hypothetical protein